MTTRHTNSKVPEPVRCHGHGNCLSPNGQGENFATDDPSDRTPGRGEECNVYANKGDQDLLTGQIGLWQCDSDDGDQEFTDEHANSPDEQESPSTSPLDKVDPDRSGEDVDTIGDDAYREWVLDARVLEES